MPPPLPPKVSRPCDFPPERLENFVWSNCWRTGLSLTADLHDLGFSEIDCLLETRSWRHPDLEHALLGTDGFLHLANGRRLLCSSSRRHRAKVAVDALPTSLLEVPRLRQCPDARSGWPGALDKTPLGAVRRQLVETLGPGCATCNNPWAQIVDHDHLTGTVRGYLCRTCNGLIDRCLHLLSCEYAAYLDRPPAAGLRLVHPDAERRLTSSRYLARRTCFEIVMNGGTSPGHGTAASRG